MKPFLDIYFDNFPELVYYNTCNSVIKKRVINLLKTWLTQKQKLTPYDENAGLVLKELLKDLEK